MGRDVFFLCCSLRAGGNRDDTVRVKGDSARTTTAAEQRCAFRSRERSAVGVGVMSSSSPNPPLMEMEFEAVLDVSNQQLEGIGVGFDIDPAVEVRWSPLGLVGVGVCWCG